MKQVPIRFAGAQMPCTPNVDDNVEQIKKGAPGSGSVDNPDIIEKITVEK